MKKKKKKLPYLYFFARNGRRGPDMYDLSEAFTSKEAALKYAIETRGLHRTVRMYKAPVYYVGKFGTKLVKEKR